MESICKKMDEFYNKTRPYLDSLFSLSNLNYAALAEREDNPPKSVEEMLDNLQQSIDMLKSHLCKSGRETCCSKPELSNVFVLQASM